MFHIHALGVLLLHFLLSFCACQNILLAACPFHLSVFNFSALSNQMKILFCVASLCARYSLSCSVVCAACGLFVFRPGEYKPLPPPKTGAYKPVPPPKPKNYRPPVAPEGGAGGGSWGYGSGHPAQPCGDADSTVASMLKQQATGLPSYQHAKSYSVAGGLDSAGYMPQHNGGK